MHMYIYIYIYIYIFTYVYIHEVAMRGDINHTVTTLEATQGQSDGFFGQLPYKCHLEEVAFLGD